ncbi:unnamed protein product [Lampetra planeri]
MLPGLVSYSSSSSSGEEEDHAGIVYGRPGPVEARRDVGMTPPPPAAPPPPQRLPRRAGTARDLQGRPAGGRLPLPESVRSMFADDDEKADDAEDGSQHGGRLRSFAHERGNWATYVYLPYSGDSDFDELVDLVLRRLCDVGLRMSKQEDFHISLSQTVVLRYHWINLFLQTLRERLGSYHRFNCFTNKVKVYTNQERTRTFLGLEATRGQQDLLGLVTEIDGAMQEFQLQTFFKDTSFHMSLAWCVGDLSDRFNQDLINQLQDVVDEFEDSPRLLRIHAEQLVCKTGHKLHPVPLR